MKKLKRSDLKNIKGAGPSPIYCELDRSCPPGLCCTAENVCKDFTKYPCV